MVYTPNFILPLTSGGPRAILYSIKYYETVEAEVKVFMIPQRVRDAESRMEVQNIKWAAEGTVKWVSVQSIL